MTTGHTGESLEDAVVIRVLCEPSCEFREIAVLGSETVADLERRLGLPRPVVALLIGRGVVGCETPVVEVAGEGGELVLMPQDITHIPPDEIAFWHSGGREGRKPQS